MLKIKGIMRQKGNSGYNMEKEEEKWKQSKDLCQNKKRKLYKIRREKPHSRDKCPNHGLEDLLSSSTPSGRSPVGRYSRVES